MATEDKYADIFRIFTILVSIVNPQEGIKIYGILHLFDHELLFFSIDHVMGLLS